MNVELIKRVRKFSMVEDGFYQPLDDKVDIAPVGGGAMGVIRDSKPEIAQKDGRSGARFLPNSIRNWKQATLQKRA